MKVFGLLALMLLMSLMQTRLHAKKNSNQLRGKLLTDGDNVKNFSLVTYTHVNNAAPSIKADNTRLALALNCRMEPADPREALITSSRALTMAAASAPAQAAAGYQQ